MDDLMIDYREAAESFIHTVKKANKSATMSKFINASHGEIMLLMHLALEKDGISFPLGLSKETGVSTARIATLLNSLEGKGLILRDIDKGDRRKVVVRVTAKGKRQALAIRNESLDRFAAILREMGEEKTRSLIENVSEFYEISDRLMKESDREVHALG